VYKQTLRSVKLTTGKKGKKIELTVKGPLRRRRSALDCSATEEEEEVVPFHSGVRGLSVLQSPDWPLDHYSVIILLFDTIYVMTIQLL
jgi:hypothetical protein